MGWGYGLVAEWVLSLCEALGLLPSATKQKPCPETHPPIAVPKNSASPGELGKQGLQPHPRCRLTRCVAPESAPLTSSQGMLKLQVWRAPSRTTAQGNTEEGQEISTHQAPGTRSWSSSSLFNPQYNCWEYHQLKRKETETKGNPRSVRVLSTFQLLHSHLRPQSTKSYILQSIQP